MTSYIDPHVTNLDTKNLTSTLTPAFLAEEDRRTAEIYEYFGEFVTKQSYWSALRCLSSVLFMLGMTIAIIQFSNF